MLLKAVIVVAVLFASLLGYAATRPDSFRVERGVLVKAPPEKIHALINDFHQWAAWSPWEKLDPAMKRTFSGAERGKGAVYEWQGNNAVGAGRMEIIDPVSPSRILVKLDFLKPMEGHNTAEFSLQPEGAATRVTWAMYGPNPFIAKLFQVFISMDRMVGGDFEKGLDNLRALAEK